MNIKALAFSSIGFQYLVKIFCPLAFVNDFSSDKTFRLIFRVLIEAQALNLSTKERNFFLANEKHQDRIIQIIFSEASENILVAKITRTKQLICDANEISIDV